MTHFETSSRDILKSEYAMNPSVQRPYKWAHLDPSFIDHAISEIWTKAGPWPRHFYDRGHSQDRKVYNWVLKWLLWHVCRYRDWRNRRNKNTTTVAVSTNPNAVPTAIEGKQFNPVEERVCTYQSESQTRMPCHHTTIGRLS